MIDFNIKARAISWNKIYSSPHWTKRKALSDEWKWRVKAALLSAKVPREALNRIVELEFLVKMPKPIDCDNFCAKMVIDGLRDWGLLKNDSPEFVKSVKVEVQKSKEEIINVRII